jgi:glycosyltransferase involved in cell wall biosynthesis
MIPETSANRSAQSAEAVLAGHRAAVLLFSEYPDDPRPRREARALAEAGMQVEVICLRQRNTQPRRARMEGVEVTRLPLQHKRGSKFRYVFEYATFLLACFALLTARSVRRRYHLIHVHNMPDVLVFSGLVPKLLGARVLLDLHDPMPELMMSIYGWPQEHRMVRWLRHLERASIGFADLVITPNIAFREVFLSRSCRPEKMQIVMNTPPEDVFSPALRGERRVPRESNTPFRLMYHGSLVARHGLDLAIEAVGRVKGLIPNVQLHIYGSRTAYLDQMLEKAWQMGLNHHVTYGGRKSLEEIVRLICDSDLGIIPNRKSPFIEINLPTRIFEYLSMGKPVIVPRTRGIGDYFGESDVLFFNLDSAADLAEKILWVHGHPEETAAVVQRGQAVYRKYLWSLEREHFLSIVSGLFPAAAPHKRQLPEDRPVSLPEPVAAVRHPERP